MQEKYPIYLLEFKTQYEVASHFLRFQEHYESPKFHDKIFTLERYMDWYAKRYGNFTYYQDWSGFNIPSHILTPFIQGKFNPLLKKERRLLKIFIEQELLTKIGPMLPFYVIGISKAKNRDIDLKHEFAHGLFYINEDYRAAVLACLVRHNTEPLEKILEVGYAQSSILDEIHAYVLTGLCGDLKKLDPKIIKPIAKDLHKIFRKHFGFSITKTKPKEILKMIHRIKL